MSLEQIRSLWQESLDTKTAVMTDETLAAIDRIAQACVTCLRNGGKILTCGNGGSACDATHFAEEIVGRFEKDRPGWAAVALPTDFASLTAVANDYGYQHTFSRQVQALGRPGDILFVISTSGNSPNILQAARTAKTLGLTVFGLLGGTGGQAKDLVDDAVVVPSPKAARVQETHILVIHILCHLIEDALTAP